MFTESQLAARFGCTVDQIRAQHADNGRALRRMMQRGLSTGRKVNGYSLAQLACMLEQTERMAKGQP